MGGVVAGPDPRCQAPVPELPPVAQLAPRKGLPLQARVLDPSLGDPSAAPIRLTCSIGVAASDTLQAWGQHLIAHADTAQYAAKRSGGNCVELATALAVT
jgi:GGDEF domain-containing protein